MKFVKKAEYNFAALLMSLFIGLELRERERRLKERALRIEKRYLDR